MSRLLISGKSYQLQLQYLVVSQIHLWHACPLHSTASANLTWNRQKHSTPSAVRQKQRNNKIETKYSVTHDPLRNCKNIKGVSKEGKPNFLLSLRVWFRDRVILTMVLDVKSAIWSKYNWITLYWGGLDIGDRNRWQITFFYS